MEKHLNEKKEEHNEHLLFVLLEKATNEINTYRNRQLTTFREAIIVQALITWGVTQLKFSSNMSGWIIRIIAGLACLWVGWVGKVIIISYKRRIYYIRDNRSELVQQIQENNGELLGAVRNLFYPTSSAAIKEEYKTRPTSWIYSMTLLVMGVLTFLINIIAGLAIN
jgi:hypothetical protein